MGNIVTNQEVVNFLRVPDDTGAIVTVGASTDPSTATMDAIVEGVEGDFNERTHHSWGALSTAIETHDLINEYEWGRGIPIHLTHRDVATFSSGAGDKIEIWDGENWDDIIGTSNWKQLEGLGKVFIQGQVFSLFREDRLRITYRYGTVAVPAGIKLVVLQKCASKLIETSLAMSNIQFGQDRGLRIAELLDKWDKEYEEKVIQWADVVRIEY